MPKVPTNLVCKVTSHLKSKTHNIALSDVGRKKVPEEIMEGASRGGGSGRRSDGDRWSEDSGIGGGRNGKVRRDPSPKKSGSELHAKGLHLRVAFFRHLGAKCFDLLGMSFLGVSKLLFVCGLDGSFDLFGCDRIRGNEGPMGRFGGVVVVVRHGAKSEG